MLRAGCAGSVVMAMLCGGCGSDEPSATTESSGGADGSSGAIGAGGMPEAGASTGGTAPAGGTSAGGAPAGGMAPAGGTSAGGTPSGGTATGGATSVGAIDCRVDGDGSTTLVFVNGCSEPLTFAGSDIEGGQLEPGAHACVRIGSDTEPLSSKRYWGWVGADPGAERHTLAEFTFNTDFYDFDWYNISHVDAHNLPLQIVPVDRPDCATLTCAESLLADCPEEGRELDASGAVVSCVSPDRDDPQSPVALYFESCDDAYAWSGDDQEGDDESPMRACAGEDWDIVFCPAGVP